MAASNQTSLVSHKRIKTSPYISEDVVDKILSFLPVKELCSLSVLAKRFRYSWKVCRDLSFDKKFARNLSKEEYKNIVNKVLCDHMNTCTDKFKLYYDAARELALVSNWIKRAVSLGVKEVELDFTPSKRKLRVEFDVAGVESIQILMLVSCELASTFNSNGLCNLREITLRNTWARPAAMQEIFANCVFLRTMQLIKCRFIYDLKASAQDLRTLIVKDCSDVGSIAINAPFLSTFHYHGKIIKLSFHCDLPHLSDVILKIAHPRYFEGHSHKNIVISLASVEALTISSTFLEGLSARFDGYRYREVEFFFWRLKEFHLLVAPESFINPFDIANFLKNCPCIERVFIDLGDNAFGHCWGSYGRGNYLEKCQVVFTFLKYVKIKGFTLKELSISMVRFFLKNAKYLRRLIVVNAKNYLLPEFYSPDFLSWGITSNANIEIYDYNRDRNTFKPQHLGGVRV